MCEIADALEQIGYEKGIYQKPISQVCRKMQKGLTPVEIADVFEEDLESVKNFV